MFSHGNNLAIGASFDRGVTNYAAYGELGTLNENLQVLGSGVIIDQGLSPTAQPPIEEPVNVDATNRYAGFYAIDVFDLTPQLSWTLSARLNIAQIGLQDRLGDALTGDHAFTRLNPGTGLAYRLSDRLTLYGGYSESNRAPTAGELSCANPSSPCLLGAILVSDPNLQQVVSRNIEFGLRGKFATDLLPGRFSWRAGAYRTDADRDIQLLATRINGFGYFSNAGTTRHQGVDAHLDYHDDRWRIDAGYSWLDATFLSAETISSNSPAANAEGLIFVRPGDRLPLNPANRFTLSADFAVTPTWSIGADLRVQSGEYLAGDESNQQPQLPGYGKLDVRTSWRFDPRFELFGEIANLLDQRTYTSGAFAQLAGLPPNFDLTDPRTYSPAPGRLLFAGVRARLD
jgi:iron complex outermembrane receptor protein